MANLEGMAMKYIVVKTSDVNLLTPTEIIRYGELLNKIANGRQTEGKEENNYLVINTDEPYANEVINIMKRNGHWG